MYAAQTMATSPKFEVTLRKAYGFGSMVMGMIPFDGQSAVFAFPGATMGAMGAAAMSRSRGSDVDEAELLKITELEASYRIGAGLRLRRAHRPARDPQRAAALARARASTGARSAAEPVARCRDHPVGRSTRPEEERVRVVVQPRLADLVSEVERGGLAEAPFHRQHRVVGGEQDPVLAARRM